ncbi:leukocyte immunoglobulin-like receptor subfamily A member 5 isoform X1 [Manis javanica]|uniref:leukocyte immunoglobulin-like receptor subfamily A member 5 isoform X1 n=1 Tax=Manis javanica TaxID=9974 RepID=UPI003C6D3D5A
MVPGLVFLLGFGFCLEQEVRAQPVQFPRPSIWASPGTLVPQGSPVTIHCRGPSGVSVWRLLKAEPHPIWEDMSPHGVQGTLSFFIPSVSHFSAGTYSCQYLKRGFWSGHSGLLDLVVTGVYEGRLSLTALPSPNVTVGGNVTLRCQASLSYMFFNLSKDERIDLPQDFFRQDHRTFLISPVTLAHRGTYRCFGSWQHSPHKWSKPSNPITLLVTDEKSGQTDPRASGNGRLPVVAGTSAAAGLLLVFLLFLLCRCWHRPRHRSAEGESKGRVKSQSSSPGTDFRGASQCGRTGRYEGPPRRLSPPSCSAAVVEVIQPEGRERVLQASLRTPLPSHPVPSLGRPSLPLASLHSQDPAGEDLQEVTYAELHLETPLGSGDPLPPCAPEASSAQPCVYAVLSLSEGGAGAGCVDSCYSAP